MRKIIFLTFAALCGGCAALEQAAKNIEFSVDWGGIAQAVMGAFR